MEYEMKGTAALLTMVGVGKLPWGTLQEEHRINLESIAALHSCLDRALADPNVHSVVVWGGPGKYFCNGLDLKWIEKHPEGAENLQAQAEALLRRLLLFPLPTVAAINGHFCAAGGMLGLAFDYRVMNRERGLFFVPAVDLGLVYSKGMTALMKAKTPQPMHHAMICSSQRYTAQDLLQHGVVTAAVDSSQVLQAALDLAASLGRCGSSPLRQRTLSAVKRNLYAEAVAALWSGETGAGPVESMGFENKPAGIDRPDSLSMQEKMATGRGPTQNGEPLRQRAKL